MQPADIARIVTLGPPTLSPDGRRAVVAATRIDLDENKYRTALWVVDTDATTPPHRLTHHPSSLVPIAEVTATAPDGYPVHGFLAVPAGEGPHPVLLMIHGGPFSQYGWTLLDEAQVYAAAGYAVVYGNPRGSSGYGFDHGRFILGDVGEKQTPDVLALLDHVLQRPDFDATRVGVLGGSHGGYMTTWLIGHTNRFGAAVSERAVNAIDSFEGSSDIADRAGATALCRCPQAQHRRRDAAVPRQRSRAHAQRGAQPPDRPVRRDRRVVRPAPHGVNLSYSYCLGRHYRQDRADCRA